jgi:hypothetical protein
MRLRQSGAGRLEVGFALCANAHGNLDKGTRIYAATGSPEPVTTFLVPVAKWSDGTVDQMKWCLECPNLRIEIWGTRFCEAWLFVGHPRFVRVMEWILY